MMMMEMPQQTHAQAAPSTVAKDDGGMVTTLPDGRPLVDNTGRAIKRKVSYDPLVALRPCSRGLHHVCHSATRCLLVPHYATIFGPACLSAPTKL